MNFWEKNHSLLGQISGYGAGLAAWLDLVKDAVGLIGVSAGAALSVWALLEKIKKKNEKDEQLL